ncbi:MAG TPA: GNAT family N-acetyltransferase [Acidimicrobiales bacterium]|nr:GNAT family N-acetyltransferase [Acidimicrobiales bacterium]
MKVIELTHFGPDEYGQIVDGEQDPYGTDHLGMDWREKSGHVALVEEGRIIAHAGWVPADIGAASGEQLQVVGLGGVMVHRAHRGNGLGHQLVAAAMERMGRLGPPVGMLFCRTERVPFYQSLGWHPMEDRVTADQPSGRVEVPLVTCWTPFLEGGSLPDSALHVDGLPF